MKVMGKWGDSEDENVILEPVKQSISSSDEIVCASSYIPVATLRSCVQFWLLVFKIVLNDPHSIKISGNCCWDHYLLVHKKKLRKLCLLCQLKQPEREQEQNWFEKLYLESIILITLPAGKEQS